jgi:hypothetical protein
VVATHYEIVGEAETADRARELLAGGSHTPVLIDSGAPVVRKPVPNRNTVPDDIFDPRPANEQKDADSPALEASTDTPAHEHENMDLPLLPQPDDTGTIPIIGPDGSIIGYGGRHHAMEPDAQPDEQEDSTESHGRRYLAG